ncbi:GNAT family N-acetyltransferase [Microbacterium sp. LWO12-1.2]|uniref:GNAT family N-acetyltransferase n=1 Tax=Microbacterium sp. LWO12-1.2 TaxID=3135261 RepID=UPI0034172537
MPRTKSEPMRDRARRIVDADWSWLAEWADDPVLDQRLGPIDTEWFAHVLADDGGVELIVQDERGHPIAVVGCVWDEANAAHVISDIAVDPRRRRSGLGRRSVDAALDWDGHPPTTSWCAFVDPENHAARQFFQSIGWIDGGVDDGMIRFSRPRQ